MKRAAIAIALLLAACVAAGAAHGARAQTWRLWWGQATLRAQGATLWSATPTDPAETHSALLTTSGTWRDQTISYSLTTLDQLRQGTAPNPWEVGWSMFHFRDLANYYWFIVKPTGYELGKKQGSDTQIFLDTGNLPTALPGQAVKVVIRVRGARIRVAVNGVQVVDYTDPNPIPSGSVGLYEEDSRVRFDAVTVTS